MAHVWIRCVPELCHASRESLERRFCGGDGGAVELVVAQQEEDELELAQLGFEEGEEAWVGGVADVAEECEVGGVRLEGEFGVCGLVLRHLEV